MKALVVVLVIVVTIFIALAMPISDRNHIFEEI